MSDADTGTALGGADDTGAPETGQTDAGGGFLDTLSDDQLSFAQEAGFSSLDDVINGYRDARGRLDGALVPPGDDATPDERAEFYRKASAAWTPEAYEFAMPDGLPENFAYDQDFAKEAADQFKTLGLHPDAAQGLHDWWVGKMADIYKGQAEATAQAETEAAERANAAHKALTDEYGAPGSQGYDNAVAKADRAMAALKGLGIDVSAWLTEKGALSVPGEDGTQRVTDPTAVRLLAHIFDQTMDEDSLPAAGKGSASNPFDMKSQDLARQTELLRSKPDEARRLIEAAGRDPKRFNL